MPVPWGSADGAELRFCIVVAACRDHPFSEVFLERDVCTLHTRQEHARTTQGALECRSELAQHVHVRSTFAGHALKARSVCARCALGVRYISADEHTTNTERVLRVYPALVHRSPRMSGVLLTCTFMRRIPRTILCMHKIPDAPSEWPRMKIVGPARSTNE